MKYNELCAWLLSLQLAMGLPVPEQEIQQMMESLR